LVVVDVMSYYHVLLSFHDAPQELRCMLFDLSEQELRARFLVPYRRGKNLLCGNEVVASSRINRVSIVRTDDSSANELKKIQEKSWKDIQDFNRESQSLVLLDLGHGYHLEDITEAGEDVTSALILRPPGDGDRWMLAAAALNPPWVSAIGTGLV
jgi:hypothetical protein